MISSPIRVWLDMGSHRRGSGSVVAPAACGLLSSCKLHNSDILGNARTDCDLHLVWNRGLASSAQGSSSASVTTEGGPVLAGGVFVGSSVSLTFTEKFQHGLHGSSTTGFLLVGRVTFC